MNKVLVPENSPSTKYTLEFIYLHSGVVETALLPSLHDTEETITILRDTETDLMPSLRDTEVAIINYMNFIFTPGYGDKFDSIPPGYGGGYND